MKNYIITAIGVVLCFSSISCGQPPSHHRGRQSTELTPQIAWYGVLEEGLAEAKRTNKPILLISAACQCGGVPGVW